jgi:hypothetical protein
LNVTIEDALIADTFEKEWWQNQTAMNTEVNSMLCQFRGFH